MDASRNIGLSPEGCGDPYGGIWFQIAPQLTVPEANEKLDQIPWSDNNFSYRDYDDRERTTSLRKEVVAALRSKDDFSRGNISTPIGSEVAIGEALRQVGVATRYHQLKEGCGGAQVSYFTVPKSVGNLKESGVFESYLTERMSSYASQLPGGSIEIKPQNLVVPDIPPHFGIKPFLVKAPSQVVSSNLSQYTWLRFGLIFNLHSETNRYYRVAVFAENSAQAPRVLRNTPPSDNHFRSFDFDDRYVIEDDIAAHVARFISGGDQNCFVGDTATNHYSLYAGDQIAISDAACTKDVLEDFG